MGLNNRKIFKYKELSPLWIAVFIDIIGLSLIIPMTPYLAEQFLPQFNEFGQGFTMGVIIAVNAMFSSIFGPLLGKISDKYGRKPLLIISQVGTMVAFMIFAFSTNLETIIISRIIDGIFGGNYPIAKAIVGDVVPPRERGIQMANVGTAHVLASLFGPFIGGTLFDLGRNIGLSGTLFPGLVGSGLSLITIILTLVILQETWSKSKRDQHKQDKKIRIKSKVRKNKRAMFYLIVWGFHTISFMILIVSIPWFGKIVLNITSSQIGIIMAVSGALRAIVRFTIFKPTVQKLGENLSIKVGLGLFVISFFIVGFSIDIILFIGTFMIVSFAASLTRGLLSSKISKSVSRTEQGKINGISSGLDSTAQILGPIIGPSMIGLVGVGIIPLFFTGIFLMLIGVIPFIMTLKTDFMKDRYENEI
ncbi:MAG: MFS transporter [Promethearchaeota archaeon]